MKEQIVVDLKNAMKNQNRDLLSVLRMVKGAVQMEEIRLKKELSDEEVIDVIAKQIKTRKESIIEFQKGNRDDLIKQTEKEIEILQKYMPEQLSKEEVENIICAAFDEIQPSTPSDMGKIMAAVSPKLKGKADLKEVSQMIKEKLSNL